MKLGLFLILMILILQSFRRECDCQGVVDQYVHAEALELPQEEKVS